MGMTRKLASIFTLGAIKYTSKREAQTKAAHAQARLARAQARQVRKGNTQVIKEPEEG